MNDETFRFMDISYVIGSRAICHAFLTCAESILK